MRALVAVSALVIAASTQAATEAPRERLSLQATASTELARDVIGVSFSTTKEGSDAAGVQAALKQALEAALTEARKIARPGQVDVQTGGFSLTPRYEPKSGKINGWQGSAELLVEGKDIGAIAQLVGRINSLNVQRVGYSLSKEAREKVEGEVAALAIARYRAKAADYSRQFGYSGFILGEVNISGDEAGPRPVFKAMRSVAMSVSGEEALPTEAGKATVSVTVSGSVQLTQTSVGR